MENRNKSVVAGLIMIGGALAGAGARAQESCDLCRTGRSQSPVRLERIVAPTGAPGPLLQRASESVRVVNNDGKNVMVLFPKPSRNTLAFDERGVFELVEFHLHAPGEHAQGASAPPPPLEAHFVHEQGGALAVIGVGIAVHATTTHALLRRVLDAVLEPGEAGAPGSIGNLDPTPLRYHAGRHLLRYSGSLTTGACDEGVAWFFYEAGGPAALTISTGDLKRYTDKFPPYARGPQPLNARVVVRVGPPRLAQARK